MKTPHTIACAIVLVLVSSTSAAQPVIEQHIRASLSVGQRPDGISWPRIDGQRAVPVTITLDSSATPAILASLEQTQGLTLRWIEGRPMHRERLVPALVTAQGLDHLARRVDVRRVSSGAIRGTAQPLDQTTSLVGVGAARRTWVDGQPLTGQGVVLADIDSSVEIFHPDFFAADGGAYDWIDVDEDGGITPGVDAVDLDGDGAADGDEILGVLSAFPTDFLSVEPLPVRPEGFSASWDWIYADTNGDGARDFGPDEGFDDDTPAFGEPLFVVDDLDGDDGLGGDERLLRLATSRIPAVLLIYAEGGTRVLRRGVDLIDLPDDPFYGGSLGRPESMHATGAISIASGGVPFHGRPMTGMAPESEVLVAYNGGLDYEAGTIWALEEGAHVVLHEYAPWVGVTLDGSDPLSEIINDSTADDGVVHVCPVGNIGGSRKHTMAELEAGETSPLSFVIPRGGYSYVIASVHLLPASDDVQVALISPSRERHVFEEPVTYFTVDEANGVATVDTTAAGTGVVHLAVYGDVPTGSWAIEVVNGSGEAVTVHGYLGDYVSSWGVGVAWNEAIATDVSTISLPSTAEACLAVGATTGHEGSDEEWWFLSPDGEGPGEIRSYSGRGPRIDGLQKPDLVAPDNPFAALPRWPEYSIGLGAYRVYGGTSGASPHVAGAAVLMAQSSPPGGGMEVIELLLNGASADELTGEVPNFDYGYGRVSLEGALGTSATGEPPRLSLVGPELAAPGSAVSVIATVDDPDGDPSFAEIRWDVGYDGFWDDDFGAVEERVVDVPLDAEEGERYPVKAEARDGAGLIDREVLWISIGVIDGDADADGDIDADADADGDADADADGDSDAAGDADAVPEADADGRDAAAIRDFSTSGGSCQCRVATPVIDPSKERRSSLWSLSRMMEW